MAVTTHDTGPTTARSILVNCKIEPTFINEGAFSNGEAVFHGMYYAHLPVNGRIYKGDSGNFLVEFYADNTEELFKELYPELSPYKNLIVFSFSH